MSAPKPPPISEPRVEGGAVSVEVTAPFHDCDPLFVVWHGRYFEYLALARAELMRHLRLDIPDVRAMGFRMYVTDARCRYMFPLHYGDRFRVTARLTQTAPLIRVSYQIDNLTHDRRSARAYTVLATTDSDGQLLTPPPEAVLERLPVLP